MGDRAVVLLVRFESALTLEEAREIVEERAPEFEALPGLEQKYYLEDVETGAVAGLYMWDSGESLESFRDSELRASIAEAYRAEGAPRIEVYRVFKKLRDEEP